jgi:hypothetical protein
VAWQLKKDQVTKEIPGITKKKFLYNLSRSSYEKEWGTEYHKPGMRTRLVTWVFKVIPKSGPFKSLAFRAPTPEVEKLFMASFNATVDSYRALLASVAAGHLDLPNENFDVGTRTAAGQYKGTDHAYDDLLGKLADHQFNGVAADLRANILEYNNGRKAPSPATQKSTARWARVVDQLRELQAMPSAETNGVR